ncbi:MAG: hypothetical protein QOJ00_2299 [Actinomycetota bacterium]
MSLCDVTGVNVAKLRLRKTGDTSTLTPYVPRVVLQWGVDTPDARYRRVEGTLAFCDLSGFTAMSEKLASLGRLGAEELADVLNLLFSALLADAAAYGGSLLKYGGDAVLLFFEGDEHAARGAAATHRMRNTLRRLGTVKTSRGTVRVRMSVGIHSGEFDFFLVGGSHRELIVSGPGATTTVEMEAAADAGEIVISPATAMQLSPSCVGDAKGAGFLLKRIPRTPAKEPLAWGAVPDLDPEPFIPVGLRGHIGDVGTDAEHRHVAVGFIAFGGVDELLAQNGGDATADVLDDFVGTCQEIFARYDVCFLYADIYGNGGKVFFLSGAPVSHEDNEERLLRAALEISDRRHDGLHLHTGLNRGYVFAGDIGAPFRRTYTVLGDAVNTAARVMASCTADGQVRAMPAVLELAASRFATEAQPPFAAKGKALPLETFAVGEPLGPRLSDAPLPLAGREAEFEALKQRLAAATDGRGGLVHVVGESGIGKSRLVQELVAYAEAEGFATVTTFAERYEQATPYFVLRQLFDVIFDGTENDADKLLSVAHDLAASHERWFPLLGPVLGLDIEPNKHTRGLKEDGVAQALGRLTIALLDGFLDGPSLWVAENAHLVDAASAGVIATVTAELANRPWVLMAVRRGEANGLSGLPGDTFTVGPLSNDDAMRLARAADPTLLHHDALTIGERSGGNPLFLRQLVSVAGEGGELADSVENAVAARIDRLAPADRDVLRTASVLGGRFELGDLRELLDGRAPDLAPLQDFLAQTDNGIVFKQALYREVAYAGLTFKRRRALHLAAGRLLEADDIDDSLQYSRLSLHYDAAQAWPQSWKYSRLAGEQTRLTTAKSIAAGFFMRALTAGRHLGVDADVLAQVAADAGRDWFHAGRIDAAAKMYALGRRLAPRDSVVMSDLQLREAVLHHASGDIKRAAKWFSRGINTLEASGADLRARDNANVATSLFAGMADCRLRVGRVDDASALADRAVAIANASGDSLLMAHSYEMPAFIAYATGDLEGARQAQEAGLALYRANPVENGSMAILEMNLGGTHQLLGDWRRAGDLLAEAHETFLKIGNDTMAAVAQANLAELYIGQGRWNDAREALDQAEPVLKVVEDEGYEFCLALRDLLEVRTGAVAEIAVSERATAMGFDAIVHAVRIESALNAADADRTRAELAAADAAGVDFALRALADAALGYLDGTSDGFDALAAVTRGDDHVVAAIAELLTGDAAAPHAVALGVVEAPAWATRIYCRDRDELRGVSG